MRRNRNSAQQKLMLMFRTAMVFLLSLSLLAFAPISGQADAQLVSPPANDPATSKQGPLLSHPLWAYRSAAAYAEQYALNPNGKAWIVFGDDCTNFVSQALIAGGHPEVGTPTGGVINNDSQWWAGNGGGGLMASTRTYSWSVANDLQDFLVVWDNHADGGHFQPAGTQGSAPPQPVGTGDVVFYHWDSRSSSGNYNHASIIVAGGKDPSSGWTGDLIDEHTSNRSHAIWNLIPYNSLATWTSTLEVHILA